MSKHIASSNDIEANEVETGSGNVFADLGLPDAEEMQFKTQLAVRILEIIEARGLTQAQAAELVGLKQPDISNLRRARLNNFTIDRLLRVLHRLGHTVQLHISEQATEDAHLLVA